MMHSNKPKVCSRATPVESQNGTESPSPSAHDFSDDPFEVEDAIPHRHDRALYSLDGPSPPVGPRRAMRPSPSPSPPPSELTRINDSPTKKSRSKGTYKTPRMTKKAQQAVEQSRREHYAQQLFDELNNRIFKGGLPEDTALKWSNRLLTTAGRARSPKQ